MASLIDRLFGRTDKTAKDVGKERLRLVLMHDRTDIPPAKMELIRQGIIEVLSRHLNIAPELLDIKLAREEDAVALVANIPLRRNHSDA